MLPFERSEYLARIANTKARMDEAGIEVLLATDPANMNYLTGYDGWSFYTPQAVLVALDDAEPLCIVRGIDLNGAKATTFLQAENNIGYSDDYVQSPSKHPMNFMADVIRACGWGNRSIGVETDAYYFSPRGYECLQADLPNAAFKDANLLVNWVRAVKSPHEIEYMRRAARIVERVMRTAVDAAAAGTRQCDAAAAIAHAQVAGTVAFGGDYPAIVPLLPTGPGTATPHLTWSDASFRPNEATILELAGCCRRYHCPMARTVFRGEPPQRVKDVAAVVVDGLNAALEAAKPGVTCEAVEAAWRSTVARSGLVKESRIGYSTGCGYPPDWGEHTMSLRPGDTSVLEPGMCFHMIPGMWMDDWGIEISECFRVTETGAEPFCSFPRELIVRT
jgi:Xaa-Pro aminopeptidase